MNGVQIQALATQADTYDEAFKQLLAQAQEIAGGFMVHLGLGQRIVKQESSSGDDG